MMDKEQSTTLSSTTLSHDSETVAELTKTPEEMIADHRAQALEYAISAGVKDFDGNQVMRDPKGRFVDVNMVKPADRLEDETVRRVMHYATDLNAQVARFKGHTFEDIASFVDILDQEYGAQRGGEKGNVTLTSYDGCMRVSISVADLVEFGPEINVAKTLFDECVSAWSVDSSPEIRTIITRAFSVEGGKYNRAELFSLLRLDIEDAKWQAAKKALQDAIRTLGTKEYLRFQKRNTPQARWETVTIDLAKA